MLFRFQFMLCFHSSILSYPITSRKVRERGCNYSQKTMVTDITQYLEHRRRFATLASFAADTEPRHHSSRFLHVSGESINDLKLML